MTDMTEIDGDTERITASLTAGWQLPAMMYSDPAVYEQEQELIFPRAWQYVGCEKDLAEPGAYLTAQLGDLPIVVVRDRDGVLHGHVNVCRHRLHPVAEGTGCRQLFQCRYHGWTYTHDGSLRSAPGLRDEDAFDRQTLGLRPIQVETFRGFVFANPDVAAEPLAEYLGGAHALVDELNLDFADWEHGGTYTYDIPANWKLFTENALECYHCPLVHQDTYATAFHTTKANYQCTEFDNVAVQVAPVTELTERLAARGGLDGFRLLYLWPVSFLSVDDFVGMVARTVPLGSHSSRFVVDAFVKPGTDPAVLEQWLDIYDRTFAEDKTVVAAQQAGYDCGAVPQGRLMTNCESTIAMFQRRTWAALADPSTTGSRPAPATPSAPIPREVFEADLRVDAVTTEADGVVSLTLAPAAGGVLPPWRPGAHIDLCLTGELTRQYSLCGDLHTTDRWTVAVLDAPASRGGSAYVHRQVAAGDTIRVRGPRNHFALPDAAAYLFVAGGIGITPILPMVEEAERNGRPWRLLYGGRSLSSMAFLDRLAQHGHKVQVRPQDTHGFLDLDGYLAAAAPGTAVMACGPSPLLDALHAVCETNGRITLHTERFTAPIQSDSSDTAFDVVLARTGVTLHVEENQSILDAALGHGVPVLSSCREGLCGTCETPVLGGEPDHRDTVLTEDERARGDTMMICVSRCTSGRLVLDL
ncbi:MAG: 2Fe-2S iron-sulfur cluster binding domain-containing protein [Rhodococcus sp. (in: high G+C Gram-positive bacteria)]|nr:MAG: 2Fe-2S iron-sulfur cluster binding domain-containing protein [Rhodococcus sp. (in: high G+C Gram-positive bacteria)]